MSVDPGSDSITFLFTDIEKSTQLWERHGERMRPVLGRHDALLRQVVEAHNGRVVKTTGDGLMAVFDAAPDAAAAALEAEQQLFAEPWAEIAPDAVRVRIGLHSGEAEQRAGDYFGTAVNRAARIMDLGHGGQVLLSAATSTLLGGALPPGATLQDLGRHTLRGLRRTTEVYQLITAGLPHDFPPLRSAVIMIGNLPTHVSSFIGRSREMSDIRAALARNRLITITGPGGTGKSRLSLQIAADIQAEYEHGAWLVELAPVTDPAIVDETVAAALNLGLQQPNAAREQLLDFVRDKEMLLILDNCEHLVAAGADLAGELIAGCPRLTILASSREGLGVYGEFTYHLPTLGLPGRGAETAEALLQSEAVRLFIERAAAVQPQFTLSDANAAAVAQIVRRLDGIPLAIELAAARLKVFPVDQVAARLDDRFRLLTGGSRTALPRQQTLRALIDWSYDLLDEEERTLFRRLAVFMGGWTFDAAESVAQPFDAFTLLPQLVDKSLVLYDPQAHLDGQDEEGLLTQPRYAYLETIRQYARDRLLEAGQVEAARDLHFSFYEAMAANVSFTAAGPNHLNSPLILAEQENLRAAVEWGVDRYPERVLNLIWNLAYFLSENLSAFAFIDWAAEALQRLDTLPPVEGEAAAERRQAQQRGRVALSLLQMFLGQLDQAQASAGTAADDLRRTDGDPLLLAVALNVQAQTGYFLENPAVSDYVKEGLALLHSMDKHPMKDTALAMILLVAVEAARRDGDQALADQYAREMDDLVQKGGLILQWIDYWLFYSLLNSHAELERLRQQRERAVAALRRGRSRRLAAMVDSDWAHRLRHEGYLDEAMAIYRPMLVEWRELGHRAAVANMLENIAFLSHAEGDLPTAATLFGAAEVMRTAAGQNMLPGERQEYDREVAGVREALGAAESERLWRRGRELSTDEVIALVMQRAAAQGEQ